MSGKMRSCGVKVPRPRLNAGTRNTLASKLIGIRRLLKSATAHSFKSGPAPRPLPFKWGLSRYVPARPKA